jgi:predicted methyltransferase
MAWAPSRRCFLKTALSPLLLRGAGPANRIDMHAACATASELADLPARLEAARVEKALLVPGPGLSTEACLKAAKESDRLLAACDPAAATVAETVERLREAVDGGAKAGLVHPGQSERVIYEIARLRVPVLLAGAREASEIRHLAETFADADFVVLDGDAPEGGNVFLEARAAVIPRILREPGRYVYAGSDAAVAAAVESLPAAESARVFRRNAQRLLRLTISAQLRDEEEPRERRDKVSDLLRLMGARPGAVVAEVGAGAGFFAVRLARAVGPGGKVYAVDIDEETLERLRQRVEEDEIGNVEVVAGSAANPGLPRAALDAILTVHAYHEMTRHQAMLKRMREALKPGGRLVLMDMIGRRPGRRDEGRRKLTESHEIAPAMVERDLAAAGFRIAEKHDPFVDRAADERVHFVFVAMP